MYKYPIYCNDIITGEVQMTRQGMFYVLHCQCDLPADQPYTMQIITPHKTFDLGICVPTERGIGLSIRLPAKELENQNLKFIIFSSADSKQELLEITETHPVISLEKALTGKFIRKEGKSFIHVS